MGDRIKFQVEIESCFPSGTTLDKEEAEDELLSCSRILAPVRLLPGKEHDFR